MLMKQWGSGLALCLIASSAACSGNSAPLDISFSPASVRFTGLSSAETAALTRVGPGAPVWQAAFSVSVAGGTGAQVAGKYAVVGSAVEFIPAFPFDPGREYVARLDPAKLPQPRAEAALERRLSLPAGLARTPTVVVSAIHPSGDVWPENVLRFYLHFSAPMSRTSSVGHVRLVDERGAEIKDALLEMDVDLWNDDRTRCTVFFDPGRVKRGIRPNRELGRALTAGRRYAIVVDAGWKDGWGQPLKSEYRHEFTAGPPVERAINTADWRVMAPSPGTQDPVEITFAWPLDQGLLQRTLGVAGPNGRTVAGEVRVDPIGRQWRFVPASPWRAGAYQIVIDASLEDPAGNQIGRPFEIDDRDPVAGTPRAERVTLPLTIK